jgi:hypothetical protein
MGYERRGKFWSAWQNLVSGFNEWFVARLPYRVQVLHSKEEGIYEELYCVTEVATDGSIYTFASSQLLEAFRTAQNLIHGRL